MPGVHKRFTPKVTRSLCFLSCLENGEACKCSRLFRVLLRPASSHARPPWLLRSMCARVCSRVCVCACVHVPGAELGRRWLPSVPTAQGTAGLHASRRARMVLWGGRVLSRRWSRESGCARRLRPHLGGGVSPGLEHVGCVSALGGGRTSCSQPWVLFTQEAAGWGTRRVMGGPRGRCDGGVSWAGPRGTCLRLPCPCPRHLRSCPPRRGGGRLPFFCSPWSPRGARTPEMGARGCGAREAVRVAGSVGWAGAWFPVCSGRLQARRAPCVNPQGNKSTGFLP